VLDATLASTPVRRELLKDVLQVQLRFMDASHTWLDQWPALGGASGTGNAVLLQTRPIAVEIVLELRDFGRIVRLVEVPG
jgi:type II secretion system protein J